MRGRTRLPPKLLAHLRRARSRGTDLGFVINDNGAPIKAAAAQIFEVYRLC
jgi:hypothetical protein